MFDLFNKFKDIIIASIISILAISLVIVSLYAYFKSEQLENIKDELKTCELLKHNEESNNVTLKATLDDLNQKALKDSIDYDTRLKEFESTRKDLLKQLNKVGSNECEDIKNRLDTIRGTDYTRLLK